MKKGFSVLLVLVIAVGVVLYGRSQLDGIGTEYCDNGQVSVGDVVTVAYDQQDLSFLCSAVFTLGDNAGSGKAIQDVTAQFIQRHKAPNELTFSPLSDVETVCQQEGTQYLLRQAFQVSHNGNPVEQIQVAAQFSYAPDTETFTVQSVQAT